MQDYKGFPDSARVWIYQSTTPIGEEKVIEIQRHLKTFAKNWVSHNNQLSAFADIFHSQFVVLMVDENQAGASGCSIDKSVHFLKQLEQHYNLNLFDRMTFTYKEGETVKTASREEFTMLYESGKIDDKTLVFDNLVKDKRAFEEKWLKPLGESWHRRML